VRNFSIADCRWTEYGAAFSREKGRDLWRGATHLSDYPRQPAGTVMDRDIVFIGTIIE
jgi:hypothetical protein